ncbi:hypothetical protein LF599_00530 [Pseudodesulfovibrio thermohalotolerans]|jgi:hypothetical protein|uniref:hypothetical protein n=1 Tax=Pseudodesulfovibrio thermohalotolerans TaxID=2880651 RepID=UPI00244312C2|nr:hypothetical protein [Pseudodesulfovibrio thermohalotolerans]WFS62675.1 hypothetical protein LF599_00530 [Pseudodesulfovibrio thermohalotolerans]
MKLRTLFFILFLLAAVPARAETDYLAMMARESEVKAIATVSKIQVVGNNADGTLKSVTFKTVYAVTPFIPKTFTGGCKTLESRWQKRGEGMIYFNPRPGQKVFVTVTTNGGAITSFTPMNVELDHVIRNEPYRLVFSHGKASIAPRD